MNLQTRAIENYALNEARKEIELSVSSIFIERNRAESRAELGMGEK